MSCGSNQRLIFNFFTSFTSLTLRLEHFRGLLSLSPLSSPPLCLSGSFIPSLYSCPCPLHTLSAMQVEILPTPFVCTFHACIHTQTEKIEDREVPCTTISFFPKHLYYTGSKGEAGLNSWKITHIFITVSFSILPDKFIFSGNLFQIVLAFVEVVDVLPHKISSPSALDL